MWRVMILPLLLFSLLLLSIPGLKVASQYDIPMAQPGCRSSCGDVDIPYPFGIGHDCFLNPWFEIECKPSPNNSDSHHRQGQKHAPLLSKLHNVKVKNIIFDASRTSLTTVTVLMPLFAICANDSMTPNQNRSRSLDLTGSPYVFSSDDNVFVALGCSGSAALATENKTIMAGCATTCNNAGIDSPFSKACYGVQCCQTPLHESLQSYQVIFDPEVLSDGTQACLAAALIESRSISRSISDDDLLDASSRVPTVLKSDVSVDSSWRVSANAKCVSDGSGGSTCVCDESNNYYGYPYVEGGCQVPATCKGCRGSCLINSALHESDSYHCVEKSFFTHGTILGISIGAGTVPLAAILFWLFRFIKRRRDARKRSVFFKRNGGMLLQQQMSSNDGAIERTKIFNASELDKATDHFNENRILGQGGQGTVYKGMLTDGRIVAIKESKLLDVDQLEQFINEVVVLSQINHRNVVKLLGCCLETEVPLLVYEFISNGTLSQHIHSPGEDFGINWALRLKVAADSASAIAYLHSSSSVPIYHGDIKPANILLDDKSRAKVSDFGSSKTIATDQTHVTTLVQGTMGYLDPEYIHSYQFTEKSDVYSFGVVLLELLTGRKPIYRCENMEQKNLVTEFNSFMKNHALSDILDLAIAKEAKEEELMAVAELAIRCLDWNGKLRPTMREVAIALEMIINSSAQHGCSPTSRENATVGMSDDGLISGGTVPIDTSSFFHIDMTM